MVNRNLMSMLAVCKAEEAVAKWKCSHFSLMQSKWICVKFTSLNRLWCSRRSPCAKSVSKKSLCSSRPNSKKCRIRSTLWAMLSYSASSIVPCKNSKVKNKKSAARSNVLTTSKSSSDILKMTLSSENKCQQNICASLRLSWTQCLKN